ncbi:STAS domain-containing protein [Actinomadura rubrisoli]|uniref:Anti-sigma factor antagonist n=1 Tax=Actinomadura rubrisoli TaxID=2530368 RepID=A0A4R5BU51_9ACTN|nr:STAS domain-containing protein [Actinomadura rubrisoli]TDD88840.1 anti-sigma factor antagonist [Actinomadura rubrisoli]
MFTIDTSPHGAWLSRERTPEHTLVAVHGELDIATAPFLRERLHTVLEDPGPLVVLDLSGVTFCDASGLALLVGARRRAQSRGAAVVLAAPRPHLEKMLHVTGLHRAFTIRSTVGGALLSGPSGRSAAA